VSCCVDRKHEPLWRLEATLAGAGPSESVSGGENTTSSACEGECGGPGSMDNAKLEERARACRQTIMHTAYPDDGEWTTGRVKGEG